MENEIKQRSQEWFKKRSARITGSRAGAILGLSPFATPDDVMREMVREYHGAEREFKGNVATEYGTFSEEYAMADLESRLGIKVEETGFCIHPEHDWLGASPDGLIGHDSVVEIKCPFGQRDNETPSFKTASEQPHYLAQMYIEMACTGRTKCYFYQWNRHASTCDVIVLNQLWLDENLPKLRAFYDQYLYERDNDFQKHLEELVQEIPEALAADEYRIAKVEMEEAKAKMDKAKEQLVKMADGKKSIIGGLTVFETVKKGAISYSKVVKEYCPNADLEPFRGKESRYWSVK